MHPHACICAWERCGGEHVAQHRTTAAAARAADVQAAQSAATHREDQLKGSWYRTLQYIQRLGPTLHHSDCTGCMKKVWVRSPQQSRPEPTCQDTMLTFVVTFSQQIACARRGGQVRTGGVGQVHETLGVVLHRVSPTTSRDNSSSSTSSTCTSWGCGQPLSGLASIELAMVFSPSSRL